MCAAYGKLLINSALGFDTYLVMRHGLDTTEVAAPASSHEGTSSSNPSVPTSKLGCYFCNDIVAATNSQKDRSLDQQCTVTRPGLSFIAAALAVELMVALQHHTPHREEGESAGDDAPEIPHQIRGSVAGFTQFTPHVSYPHLSVCLYCTDVNDFCCLSLYRHPHSLAAQPALRRSCRRCRREVSRLCVKCARTRRCWSVPAAWPA